MKTVYTLTVHFPSPYGFLTTRTLYFGTLKARTAVLDEVLAKGFKHSTNIEHVYTEAEGLKSIDIEERFASRVAA